MGRDVINGGQLRCFDIVRNVTGFDDDWYAKTFADARLMGLSAEDHFKSIGYRLGRGVSSRLPRLDHSPDLVAALRREPRISYCTPVMNRPDDVRATLEANLSENRDFAALVEFVLVFMDRDNETQNWIQSTFVDDLQSGYLRLIVEPPLESWHFGRAKNRHRAYARGDLYSSVDGDNFVTREETEQLLGIADQYQDRFVFHHFTGRWGDGSSGRVSLPMSIYRSVGYDETFMPRQYDEMDLILSVMSAHPDLPLVRVRSNTHGLSGQRSQGFVERAGIDNPVVEVAPPRKKEPINPKTSNYVQADHVMEAMTTFNQGLCFLKNATDEDSRSRYLRLAVQGRHQLVDAVPAKDILQTLFYDTGDAYGIEVARDDICLFACMKNDDGFLPAFHAHYCNLGVRHFFIVDDGSDIAIEKQLPHANVHVFRPKVGTFVTAKGMWLDGLIKAFLLPGQWALTVDADEFLDLPVGFDTLQSVAHALDQQDRTFAPALLLDMLPGAALLDETQDVETDFLKLFDHYGFTDTNTSEIYANTQSVKWGFGPYHHLSWQLDTRYHAFGTFDALRKTSLFRVAEGRHVNQGFHTLHHTNGQSDPGHDIWDADFILAIRHFKLLKLFSQSASDRMASHVASGKSSPYHPRTSENIARIFGTQRLEQIATLMALPRRPYSDGFVQSLKPRAYFSQPVKDQR